jgi:hypothetical protein
MARNRVSLLNYSVSDKPGEAVSVLERGASFRRLGNAQLTESGDFVPQLGLPDEQGSRARLALPIGCIPRFRQRGLTVNLGYDERSSQHPA